MLSKKLPTGGSSFKISGTGGFERKFFNLVNYGQFSSLKNNREIAIKIFKGLVPTIKRDGKIPLSTRIRAVSEFDKYPNTTRQDVLNFKKILEFYK
ncbi:hypothetical protein CVU82_01595 [Candidatus Falkowbacteria bacterium HGW-Falkowbacteria-1]|uniref:Uncharacterized protein n=1 Tax=Candidatus Falkowbacteria bacterium HGW-Falkowbacteria-1 TaxID=2013768 RepID=A0A2N2E949_9BACT|nr:MAG: hypothetical protein CVU82_01595 [Candidatus Falkowbacteria bacterium HGW-Falkowbacteria-1]